MAAMEASNAQYNNGHHQQPGPPLPASPTLTNPDMILPDYDRSDSPDHNLGPAAHPSLMMWNSAHTSTSAPDIHQMFVATGLAGPHPYGPTGPVTPTTPIIYGNGTMLSDIGEVTEVESTVGKPLSARTKSAVRRPASPKRGSGSEGALRPSPTITTASMNNKKSKQSLNAKHERRSSIESNSTITEDHARVFADFDDSVSVGDSVFQGDDEESMASSYVEGTAAIESMKLGVPKLENVDRLSTYSTTSLSRRAEEILANAKKRLTTMEGNLTRARSTLHYTSPYGSEGSTPSPPFQRASTAMYPMGNGADYNASPPDPAPEHTRMSSDVAMPNGLPYRVPLPRSQSALGAAGGYRQPLTASRSADYIRGDMDDEAHRPRQKANSVREAGLKPLTEDEVARLGEADSASHNARLEAFLSPTFGSFHSDNGMRNVQRSSSAAQMRDIKDQMRDLKGKISSLREQARVDNMKRQSLQSLRTPSPFTYSQIDNWYGEPPSNRASEIISDDILGIHPWNGEESSVDGDAEVGQHLANDHVEGEETDYADAEDGGHPEDAASHYPDNEQLSASMPAVEAGDDDVEDDVSDMQTENGDMDEDHEQDFHDADDAGYVSESGESLYHDTVQHQISHEDREDAFDYEHFFLHSAMGSMSMARRASAESCASDDSVETTRGPVAANGANGGDYAHEQPTVFSRRNSSNSISTIDTFATAQEPAVPLRQHGHKQADGSISPIAEESSTAGSPAAPAQTTRRHSVIHHPLSTAASSLHRPSVSSFDSVGTNRSFPLVNKPSFSGPGSRPGTGAGSTTTVTTSTTKRANSTGVLTPRDSPDPRLMSDMGKQTNGSGGGGDTNNTNHDKAKMVATSGSEVTNNNNNDNGGGPHPLEALLREDKYLVERLVASMGRCVLGLTENGRASAESRMYRRRLDAARRVLEGLDF
ncbi:hypothetical protein C8A00DRAFT_43191 [Chaetomidium leptoderma]|uniref:Uncharacterized protein n=1 Tax=Chaetomidium leptoderma TaxID=669021 RepID=A0AAN6ZXI8_9PEZI|nr:hypothetical protein C8A00DRAFT_43191 [Chaetomidium leptoderma]